MNRRWFFAVTSVTIGLTSAAHAQEEDVNFDFDAQVGFESLEEPNKSGQLESNPYVGLNASALAQLWNAQLMIHGPIRFNVSDFPMLTLL